MQTIYWLVLFVILLIIEILTMGLTTIWFAAGALAAFLAGWLGFGLAVQIVVFLVVSVVLLLLTRPIAVKYFNQERQKTNAARQRQNPQTSSNLLKRECDQGGKQTG